MENSLCKPGDKSEDSSIALTPSVLEGKTYRFSTVVSEESLNGVTRLLADLSCSESKADIRYGHPGDLTDDTTADITQPNDFVLIKKDHSTQVLKKMVKKKKGDILERLVFCKVKLINAEGKGQAKKSRMRKSFWLYPIDEDQLSKDLKEESNILTSFFFDTRRTSKLKDPADRPLAFIYHFFSNYKAENSKMSTFMLNKNSRQEEYANIYNLQGNRYFFACLFDDFEESKVSVSELVQKPGVELSQTLLLIESRYPFRNFFSQVLTRIFDIIRVRRLEKYAMSYNGQEDDCRNLDLIKNYDASTIQGVGYCY